MQCEIWSTNPLTFTKGNMTEESITHEIRDSKTGTLLKATRQDINTETHSRLPDITAGASKPIQPVAYPAENIIPDTPLILIETTDTVIHENKATGSIANVSANSTMTDVQICNPETTEENLSQNTVETNLNTPSVEKEIVASENKVCLAH